MRLIILAFVACAGSYAAQIPVAILGSPSSPAWNTDVQGKLAATGFFSTVDVFDISTTTPTLATLNSYSSLLVYSDNPGYDDAIGLGDNLADYVDGGGGVVAALFSVASIPFGGRFVTDNYWVLQPASQTQGAQLTLGTILEPGSPLLNGVSSFDGGSSSYISTGTLHPNAIVVAEWSNGAPLIARRTMGGVNRVDLNFFPPSSDSRSDFWNSSTDGGQIIANALVFTGGASEVPEPGTLLLAGVAIAGTLALRRIRS